MKIVIGQKEKMAVVTIAFLIFAWFERAQISDFIEGARAGFHVNQSGHR